jgi:hypothetical protein
MTRRSLLARIEILERAAEQRAIARSRTSLDCICFPEMEIPFFGFPIEGDIAFAVKCPLHGDRFKWPRFFIYVARWRRENEKMRRQGLSAQYHKAWTVSFPPHLWPAVEEETELGTYLHLRDGTRILAYEYAWKKRQLSPSGCTERDNADTVPDE